jgi:hypothetical protein
MPIACHRLAAFKHLKNNTNSVMNERFQEPLQAALADSGKFCRQPFTGD